MIDDNLKIELRVLGFKLSCLYFKLWDKTKFQTPIFQALTIQLIVKDNFCVEQLASKGQPKSSISLAVPLVYILLV